MAIRLEGPVHHAAPPCQSREQGPEADESSGRGYEGQPLLALYFYWLHL
jgi:hypothetical protein